MRLIHRAAHNFSGLVISMILDPYAYTVFRIICLPISSEIKATFSGGTQFALVIRWSHKDKCNNRRAR